MGFIIEGVWESMGWNLWGQESMGSDPIERINELLATIVQLSLTFCQNEFFCVQTVIVRIEFILYVYRKLVQIEKLPA